MFGKICFLCCAIVFAKAGYLGGSSISSRRQDDLGNYAFNYGIVDPVGAANERWEAGDAYGNKRGAYSLTDIDGRTRRVEYLADSLGFRAGVKTNEPGTAASVHAAAVIDSLYDLPVAPRPASAAPAVVKPLPAAAPAVVKPLPAAIPRVVRPIPTAAPSVVWPLPNATPSAVWPLPNATPSAVRPFPVASPSVLRPLLPFGFSGVNVAPAFSASGEKIVRAPILDDSQLNVYSYAPFVPSAGIYTYY